MPLLEGSRFDIAYIDGWHHPRHALEDALAVWPLLNPRAIAIFDDYGIGAHIQPISRATSIRSQVSTHS